MPTINASLSDSFYRIQISLILALKLYQWHELSFNYYLSGRLLTDKREIDILEYSIRIGQTAILRFSPRETIWNKTNKRTGAIPATVDPLLRMQNRAVNKNLSGRPS